MQEDVEMKTVMLVINGSKLTGRTLKSAIQKLLAHMRDHSRRDVTPHGKQTVKQLLQKDQGASTIEINDPSIKDFERIARKYGVDYAIKKCKGDKPKYTVDILEPHDPSRKDNYPKAVGLAKFASTHWDKFGRIQLIRKMNGPDGNEHFYRLDMSDLNVCQRVIGITSNQELDHIFDEAATRDE